MAKCGLPYQVNFALDDIITVDGRVYKVIGLNAEQDHYLLRCLSEILVPDKLWQMEYVNAFGIKT